MLKRFWVSEGGNFAAIFGIAIIPTMAGVAGAIDVTTTLNKASEVQNALDASGLAAAAGLMEGAVEAELSLIGERSFRANLGGHEKLTASFALSVVDSKGATLPVLSSASPPESYILVESDLTHEGMIASGELLRAHRQAMVRVLKGKQACLLALNKSASSALKIQGSTSVNMANCVMASNSRAADSVTRGGSASVTAECISSAGGVIGLTENSYTKLNCDKPLERQYAASDPLAAVVPPPFTGCKNAPNGKSPTLTPGTYCDSKLSGDITLSPGTYIFRGTQIKPGGNGALKGDGVTIFLMEGATLTSGANDVVKITAPQTGSYGGIAIYQEASTTHTLSLLGGGETKIEGFVYAPGALITFAGNTDSIATPHCMRLVADKIEMTGNSTIGTDCNKELGDRRLLTANLIGLVK